MKSLKSSQKSKKRVLVAMSGGVDSSVAALLLKRKGYEVFGVTMCFGFDGAKGGRPSCCSVSEISDAKRVADQIGINHYVLSFGKLLKNKVIKEFVSEYSRGRTPNPCVRCNQFIKFGELLRKARQLDCDFLATGHYAKIVKDKKGSCSLHKAKDSKKDQSYFLFRLPKEAMDSILFPLGGYTKAQVRSIARVHKLRVADKPGSQDVCFIPDRDLQRFLADRVTSGVLKPGPIKNLKGDVLGNHKGIILYTIGQRQGLGIAHTSPLYVVKIDSKRNTLIVGEKKDVYGKNFEAKDLHLLGLDRLPKKLVIEAKIRYNHSEANALIYPLSRNRVCVEFRTPQWAITPGQSVVFYKRARVIGGATIERNVN